MTDRQLYESCYRPQGLTVSEFEHLFDLQPWTVYPELRDLEDPNKRGYYMYRNMTYEDFLNARESCRKTCVGCGGSCKWQRGGLCHGCYVK